MVSSVEHSFLQHINTRRWLAGSDSPLDRVRANQRSHRSNDFSEAPSKKFTLPISSVYNHINRQSTGRPCSLRLRPHFTSPGILPFTTPIFKSLQHNRLCFDCTSKQDLLDIISILSLGARCLACGRQSLLAALLVRTSATLIRDH